MTTMTMREHARGFGLVGALVAIAASLTLGKDHPVSAEAGIEFGVAP